MRMRRFSPSLEAMEIRLTLSSAGVAALADVGSTSGAAVQLTANTGSTQHGEIDGFNTPIYADNDGNDYTASTSSTLLYDE